MGRGDGQPTRPHLPDARAARRRAAQEPDRRQRRGALRSVPRLHGVHAGLPVGGPLRHAHRTNARAARNRSAARLARSPLPRAALRAPALPAPTASARCAALALCAQRSAGSRAPQRFAAPAAGPPGAARRARARAAIRRSARRAAGACTGAGRAPRARGPAERVRPARVLSACEPGDRARARRRGLRRERARRPGLLRRALDARGTRARGEVAGARLCRRIRAPPDRLRRGQRRRLRLASQELCDAAGGRAGVGRTRTRLHAQGAGRERAARDVPAARDAPPGARPRRLSRRLPSGARAGDPRSAARAPARHPRAGAGRDPRRRSMLRQRRDLQPDAAGGRRRDRRAQGEERALDRARSCWPPPTPAARCRSRSCCGRAARRCRPRTRSRSSTPPSAACRFSAWAESESCPRRRKPAGAR